MISFYYENVENTPPIKPINSVTIRNLFNKKQQKILVTRCSIQNVEQETKMM